MAKGKHSAKLKQQRPIVDELTALQNAHRLAIHIWEGNEMFKPHPSYVFPQFSYDTINTKTADQIATALGDETMPILSMSLLPSQKSGLGLRPFCCSWNQSFLHGGYLVDVSEQPDAARIQRAALHGLGSGPNPLDKAMRLGRKEFNEVPELKALYETYLPPRKRGKARRTSEGEDAFRQAIASEEGAALSALQLDLLGKHYESSPPESIDDVSEVGHLVEFNEILVAAAKSHIKAIVIPSMPNPNQPAAWFDPMVKLSGALAGLQHLKQGMDLPVVMYHVTPPQQGQLTYLAQGKAECINTALAACKELEQAGLFGSQTAARGMATVKADLLLPKLQTSVAEALDGLDITKPLAAQKAVVAALEKQANPRRQRS